LTGGGTMTVNGMLTHSGKGNLEVDDLTTLVIGTSGTYNIQTNGGITQGGGGGGALIDNGIVEKSLGTGTSTISVAFDNENTVAVHGGTLSITGPIDQDSGNTLTGGSWAAYGTSTVAATLNLNSNITTIGLGTTVRLDGPNSTFMDIAKLAVNKGTLVLSTGQSFAMAGKFTNYGVVNLSPGSVLMVDGNFTQQAGATVAIQLGGTNASPTIGSIATAAGFKATLNGTLHVTSTVVPAVGSAFTLLANGGTAADTGTFAGLPEGSKFTVTSGATKMKFQITYKGGANKNSVQIKRIS